MAGSRRPSIYLSDVLAEDDTPKILIINGDESNAEATGGLPATDANIGTSEFVELGNDALRIEPRYILLEGQTTGGKPVRRRIIAYDPESSLYQDGGTLQMLVQTGATTSEVVTFNVSGMVGEKRTMVKKVAPTDTGLDDGDAT